MWTERVWLLLNILAPSVSFLLFREASFMPGLYVVQQLAQQMALYAVTIRAGNHPCNNVLCFTNLFTFCSTSSHKQEIKSGDSNATMHFLGSFFCSMCIGSI